MGQIGGIIGDKCQARAGDGFGEGGGSSGNHRNSARHGFQNRNAEALVNRRHDEHIGRPIAIEELFLVKLAQEMHSVRNAKGGGSLLAALRFRGVDVAGIANHECMNCRSRLSQMSQGLDKNGHTFVGRQSADKQQEFDRT